MGLSPANQSYSILPTNVVGTPGYIDPMYMETYSLTKESDVYSFGVVLFEVLTGRLCFKYSTNDGFQSLVPIWKLSYEEKKLDEITFHEVKQQMDQSSMETFSDIAYQCLQKSRADRPKMSHVVKQLEIALKFQDIFEEADPPLPMDYEEISKTAVPPLVYKSEEELKMLLCKGILVNGGKTWFLLNRNGEHCEMISAAECLVPLHYVSLDFVNYSLHKSRFAVRYHSPLCYEFKTHVRTQFLSPHITYTVYLLFQVQNAIRPFLCLNYILAGETKSSTSYIADKREDVWLMAELFQFSTSDKRNVDFEIMFKCEHPLQIEGIEFQPVERLECQVLEDHEEVDMQTETDWEQNLPNDWEEIIKWSKDSVQWTTKKELYSILCKGFPIKNGQEWFYISKNGKKCYMLSATVALQKEEWRWQSLPESRFEEVGLDPEANFWIDYRSDTLLSPETTYGCYLVYKLQENHSGVEAPVKVSLVVSRFGPNNRLYVFLLTPQSPIIGRKVYQNTHYPLYRPKMKGLPQHRNDGWMEVKLWEFQTGNTTASSIWGNLQVTASDKKQPLKGLIVQGIEFKP